MAFLRQRTAARPATSTSTDRALAPRDPTAQGLGCVTSSAVERTLTVTSSRLEQRRGSQRQRKGGARGLSVLPEAGLNAIGSGHRNYSGRGTLEGAFHSF